MSTTPSVVTRRRGRPPDVSVSPKMSTSPVPDRKRGRQSAKPDFAKSVTPSQKIQTTSETVDKRRGRPPKTAEVQTKFFVELNFPHELLACCVGMQQQEHKDVIAKTGANKKNGNKGENISISIDREEDRIHLVLEAMKDFPVEMIENRWRCTVNSVSLTDDNSARVTKTSAPEPKSVEVEESPPTKRARQEEQLQPQETVQEERSATVASEVTKQTEATERNQEVVGLAEKNAAGADITNLGDLIADATEIEQIIIESKIEGDGTSSAAGGKEVPLIADSEIDQLLQVESQMKDSTTTNDHGDGGFLSSLASRPKRVRKPKVLDLDEDHKPIKVERDSHRASWLSPNPTKEYSCDKCPSVFHTTSGLMRHKMRKHNNMDKPDNEENNVKRLIKTEPQDSTQKTPNVQDTSSEQETAQKTSNDTATNVVATSAAAMNDITTDPAVSNPVPVKETEKEAGENKPDHEKVSDTVDVNGDKPKKNKRTKLKKKPLSPRPVKVRTVPLLKLKCPSCECHYQERKSLIKHAKLAHAEDRDLLLKCDQLCYESSKRYSSSTGEKATNLITMTQCAGCGVERAGRSILKHVHTCHSMDDNFQEILDDARKTFEMENSKTRSLLRKTYQSRSKKENVMYICQFCGKQFQQRTTRLNHEKFRCPDNPNRQKLIECYLCGFASPSKEKFDEHVKKHEGFSEIKCPLCPKTYQTRAGLTVHSRKVHNIIKKHPLVQLPCDICHKVFYDKDHLRIHKLTHSDARTYQCELCGGQYKTAGQVQKHQKMVHFNRYKFHCDKCGHGVEKASYLRMHKCGRVRRVQSQEKAVSADPNDPRTLANRSRAHKKRKVHGPGDTVQLIRLLSRPDISTAGHVATADNGQILFQMDTGSYPVPVSSAVELTPNYVEGLHHGVEQSPMSQSSIVTLQAATTDDNASELFIKEEENAENPPLQPPALIQAPSSSGQSIYRLVRVSEDGGDGGPGIYEEVSPEEAEKLLAEDKALPPGQQQLFVDPQNPVESSIHVEFISTNDTMHGLDAAAVVHQITGPEANQEPEEFKPEGDMDMIDTKDLPVTVADHHQLIQPSPVVMTADNTGELDPQGLTTVITLPDNLQLTTAALKEEEGRGGDWVPGGSEVEEDGDLHAVTSSAQSITLEQLERLGLDVDNLDPGGVILQQTADGMYTLVSSGAAPHHHNDHRGATTPQQHQETVAAEEVVIADCIVTSQDDDDDIQSSSDLL